MTDIPNPPIRETIITPIGLSRVWDRWFREVFTALNDAIKKIVSATSGNIATFNEEGDLTDSGVAASSVLVDDDIGVTVQPYDATILVDADIGVTVQAYDANIVSDADYVHTDTNYTAAEAAKLAGIEAGADVTDADNVAAAGAIMTEVDPVFTSWDKSTGISVTLAQISDRPTPATDGTYTVGLGTVNGTITISNGIITAVQEAS